MARPNASGTDTARLPASRTVACVTSTYHFDIVGGMLASARETLLAAGLESQNFLEQRSPGAFELPLLAQEFARRDDIDAVLAFGLVLKGETDHDRYISHAVTEALMRIGLETRKPVLFGLLTCNTLEQAEQRARRASDGGLDKGAEVARAAVALLCSLDELSSTETGGAGGPLKTT